MDGDGSGAGPTTKATRLTIVHKGNEVRVISSQTVRMTVPPTDQTYSFDHHGGFYFAVHDADGEVLYRRVIPNPFVGDVEALSGDPDRPFTRVPSPDKEKVSVLLVPVLDEARELRLYASPPGAVGAKARAIATLDLVKPAPKMTILETTRTPKKPRPTKKRGK